MASRVANEESARGFGRGSPVREYWLVRCDGFDVVRADGRRLGRVKRLDHSDDGPYLRVGRLRSRAVPASAVDTVWPARSLLVLSGDEIRNGTPVRAPDDRTRAIRAPSPGGSGGAAVRAQASRAVSLLRALVRRTHRESERLGAFLGQQAGGARRATAAGLRAARRSSRAALASLSRLVARERVRLGRALFRLAVGVAGDREALRATVATGRDSETSTPS